MLMSMNTEHSPNPGSPSSPVSTLTRPVFTLRQASTRCGVSFSTIRRRREDGAFPNAYKTPDGQWMVPVEDLLAAGLKPTTDPTRNQDRSGVLTEPAHDGPGSAHDASSAEQKRISELERELARARAQIEVEQAHRAAAEQVAAERARSLDDLRTAIRLLEPPKPATDQTLDPSMRPEPTPATNPRAVIEQTGPVKRWLNRRGRAGG